MAEGPTSEGFQRRLAELERRLQAIQREIDGLRSDLRERKEAAAAPARVDPVEPCQPAAEKPPERPPERPPARPPQAEGIAAAAELPPVIAAPAPVRDTEPPAAAPPAGEAGIEVVDEGAPPEDVQLEEPARPVGEAKAAAGEPEPARAAAAAAPAEPAALEPIAAGAAADRGAERMDLETRIGGVWFLRIGLLVLVIGFVLFGRWITPELQPWHKVLGCYLAAAALFALGWYFDRKLRLFSRPVMAGGLALAFFASFAAHFLEPMRCMGLPGSLALMSASVGAIFLCSDWWRSEPTAGFAIFLGHVAAYVAGGEGRSDAFSLIAIVFLSAAALILFLRHDWLPLNLFAVAAAYCSHLAWAVFQQHPESTPVIRFWANFPFLSSYYVIFLLADCIYRWRLWRGGKDAYTALQRSAGRGVGPLTLVLHATIAAAVFRVTGIYWERIHFFWFPLAALQIALVLYHRRVRNPDYPFYLAAATVFATLGLFSWLGGLTLNLALAAEALLLLVMARRLRFWFLNPIAQAVLAINFIHYWLSDASRITTWPLFLGSVSTALVYFVKSRLEETWTPLPADELVPERRWAAALRRTFDQAVKPLACVHAVLGAVLLFYQCASFFDLPGDAAALAGFAAAAVVAAGVLGSAPLVLGAWALEAAVGILLLWNSVREAHDAAHALPLVVPLETLWLADQGIALGLAALGWIPILAARLLGRPFPGVLGMGGLLLAIPSVFIASGAGVPDWRHIPLWAAAALIFWVEADLFRGVHPPGGEPFSGGWFGRLEEFLSRAGGAARCLLALAAAGLTARAVAAVLPGDAAVFWTLGALTWAVLLAALRRGRPPLALGLAAHLGISSAYLIHRLSSLPPAAGWELYTWWVAAGASGCAAVLIPAAAFSRRGSFAWCGLAALAASMGTASFLLGEGIGDFSPFALWLAAAAGFWIAAEALRLGFRPGAGFAAPNGSGAAPDWRDRIGLAGLEMGAGALSILISIAAALILVLMTRAHFDHGARIAGFAAGYLVACGLLGALLRSPALCSACVLFLGAAHLLLYGEIGITAAAEEHPLLGYSILGITFAAGAGVEASFRRREKSADEAQRTWSALGSWYPYVLGFLLGWLFLAAHAQRLFETEALAFPYQMGLAAAAFAAAWPLRLGWLQLAAAGFAGCAAAGTAVLAVENMEYRTGFFLAGLLMAIELAGMERIAAWQEPRILGSIGEKVPRALRTGLVVGAGALLMAALYLNQGFNRTWTTFGWSATALSFALLGFLWRDPAYRRTALGIFALAIVRIMVTDVWELSLEYRILAFIGLGACLVAVSFLYTRFQKQIQRWL